MTLDDDARWVLDRYEEADHTPWEDLGAGAARDDYESTPPAGGWYEVASIEDHTVETDAGPVQVRVFRPAVDGPVPVIVYYHGGGWVLGSLASYDRAYRSMAAMAGATVVAVDYRLAPEHPYPAAADDAYAALVWASDNRERLGGDDAPVIVLGDSAGGNLAAVVSIMARDRGGPDISLQVLVYPVTDFDADRASMVRNAEGYLLTRSTMRWFYDQYCPEPQRKEAYAAPLRADDLSGVAPAHVLVAGYDPLYDEGIAYAARLAEAGVPTTLVTYPGQFHGFFTMTAFIAAARRAHRDIANAVALTRDPLPRPPRNADAS